MVRTSNLTNFCAFGAHFCGIDARRNGEQITVSKAKARFVPYTRHSPKCSGQRASAVNPESGVSTPRTSVWDIDARVIYRAVSLTRWRWAAPQDSFSAATVRMVRPLLALVSMRPVSTTVSTRNGDTFKRQPASPARGVLNILHTQPERHGLRCALAGTVLAARI